MHRSDSKIEGIGWQDTVVHYLITNIKNHSNMSVPQNVPQIHGL